MHMEKNVRIATHVLLYSFAVFLLVMGSDKAFHFEKITDWEVFVGPLAAAVFPFPAAETIVRVQGCIEIFYGIALLFTKWKRAVLALFALSMVCMIIDLAYFRYFILIAHYVLLLAVAGALIVLISDSTHGTRRTV